MGYARAATFHGKSGIPVEFRRGYSLRGNRALLHTLGDSRLLVCRDGQRPESHTYAMGVPGRAMSGGECTCHVADGLSRPSTTAAGHKARSDLRSVPDAPAVPPAIQAESTPNANLMVSGAAAWRAAPPTGPTQVQSLVPNNAVLSQNRKFGNRAPQ